MAKIDRKKLAGIARLSKIKLLKLDRTHGGESLSQVKLGASGYQALVLNTAELQP